MSVLSELVKAVRRCLDALREAFERMAEALRRLVPTVKRIMLAVVRIEAEQAAYEDWDGVLWPRGAAVGVVGHVR